MGKGAPRPSAEGQDAVRLRAVGNGRAQPRSQLNNEASYRRRSAFSTRRGELSAKHTQRRQSGYERQAVSPPLKAGRMYVIDS